MLHLTDICYKFAKKPLTTNRCNDTRQHSIYITDCLLKQSTYAAIKKRPSSKIMRAKIRAIVNVYFSQHSL